MKNTELAATNNLQWWITALVSVCGILLAIFWKEDSLLLYSRIAIVCVLFLLIMYAFLHGAYSSKMSYWGLSCSFLGRKLHSYAWYQIEEIAIINDYRIPNKNHSSKIIAIPKGCPLYDSKKWFGLQYLLIYRDQIIWMDNTETNRKHLSEYFGKLKDYR